MKWLYDIFIMPLVVLVLVILAGLYFLAKFGASTFLQAFEEGKIHFPFKGLRGVPGRASSTLWLPTLLRLTTGHLVAIYLKFGHDPNLVDSPWKAKGQTPIKNLPRD